MLSYARIAHREKGGVKLPLTPTLDNQVWAGTGVLEKAEYIEALDYSEKDLKNPGGFTLCPIHGMLHGTEILEWVCQRGPYSPLEKQHDQVRGGVRLLVLERSAFQPPSYDIRKDTYLAIAKQFNLPENTVLALSGLGGATTYNLDVDDINGVPQSLKMVIKASQKFQVGNYGLAFSHDFATGISSGILHGTGVTQYGNDYELWDKPPVLEILEHIKTAHRLWTHPLFLPTIVLQHHVLRTDYFCTVVLSNRVTDLELQMGTMRGGRLQGVPAPNFATRLPVQEAKLSLRKMTIAMSTLMFDIICFCGVSDWQCSCLKHLADIHSEIEGLVGRSRQSRSMRETIQYLLASAESVKMNNRRLQEVGQSDMSVLYSIISQVDNRLNAKIAAASSRDSAAMKTLAFLTTLFLPGTFIATIFSTGMFDWKVGSDDKDSGDSRVVSKLFWVYWAFTVPLTTLVGVGWRVWWSWEKKHFDDDVDAAVEAVDGQDEVPSGTPQAPDYYKVPYWEGVRKRMNRKRS